VLLGLKVGVIAAPKGLFGNMPAARFRVMLRVIVWSSSQIHPKESNEISLQRRGDGCGHRIADRRVWR